jgi:ADP-ribosylglycohydrolase
MSVASKDQFLGCLLGVAIGDALGFPVERLSLAQIHRRYGPEGVRDFVSGERYPPGTYSDDTQLTLATARALLQAGEGNLDQIAEALALEYLAWYRSPESARGPGRTTLAACANLSAGIPWRESGIRESKGCGSAMRVAPIGLYFHGDKEKLIAVARASSVITHAHPTGVGAAVLNAYTVACLLDGVAPGDLLHELLPMASSASAELAAVLGIVQSYGRLGPAAAFAQIGETGSAEEVFASAVFCFLRKPEDFRATVLAAANSNGDSDSIAAMAGGFSGACNGVQGIPEKWLQAVENRQEIEELSLALHAQAPHSFA